MNLLARKWKMVRSLSVYPMDMAYRDTTFLRPSNNAGGMGLEFVIVGVFIWLVLLLFCFVLFCSVLF